MRSPIDLSLLRRDDSFQSSPHPQLVMDQNLVVCAVNRACLRATQTTEDEVLDRHLFQAYPASGDPDNDGPGLLERAFEIALRHRRAQHLMVHRYDVRDRTREGGFVPRWWVPVTQPVIRDDQVVGLHLRADPVTRPNPAGLEPIRRLRDAAGAGIPLDEPWAEERLADILAAVECLNGLGVEVSQLREALVSRATIEQAKGLVMAARACDPDEAFAALVKLSNQTNVRLADVAAAMVYRATSGQPPPTS